MSYGIQRSVRQSAFEVIIPNTLSVKNVMGWLLTSFILFFFLWFIVPVGILYLLACAFTGTSPFAGHSKSEKIKKLVIDDKKIVCYSNLGKRTNLRSQIKRLCYARSYEFDHFYDESNRKIRRGKVSVEPQLMIYIGSNVRDEYIIEGLTNAECWWIGQELSDFLDLELQVIYPTPKVPPEPSCGGGC
ncbi:hypothetical protein [Acaryochloris sp. CCMEE 5410]|uniref:hypothetical protein n=1 Tax=Acaryochloris sp. CCMEE 5410 TaxID=310037 RepID=UPI0002483D27|nr:hypothetical protein [Acaryochloris sp. CCMEE 5410]KAI9134307.1 hypothetical protein ON05_014125 [Acaryochloris sp. CCMEE 5410]